MSLFSVTPVASCSRLKQEKNDEGMLYVMFPVINIFVFNQIENILFLNLMVNIHIAFYSCHIKSSK